ncbi:hypothetical protein HY045_02065 [Candidatus Woesebacteria bacterium]|nr:hypothetical protein [Candidatus Woesebacteria bacterium]
MERRKGMLIKTLEVELGITSSVILNQVRAKLRDLSAKIETDLSEGFTFYEVSGDRYSAVYTKGPNKSSFMISKTIFVDRVGRETIWSDYVTTLGKISVIVGKPLESFSLRCRVFLDGNLVSGSVNKNFPYGFSLRMLKDFEDSRVDVGKTKFIFDRMTATGFPFWNKKDGKLVRP